MDSIKTTAPKTFCFVLMPFDGSFNDVYQLGIKQACADAGVDCERVDEQIFHERILDRIYNQISKADFVIADMTERNANVFYEVGYAHALGKPTILLTKNLDDILFDLKHFSHIVYENRITKLKEELTKRVRWVVENAKESTISSTPDIDLYLDGKSLSWDQTVFSVPFGEDPYLSFSIQNNSPRTFQSGDFHLGIITDKTYKHHHSEYVKEIPLPEEKFLYIRTSFDVLFPGSFTVVDFWLTRDVDMIEREKSITIRVFTNSGTNDFALTILEKEAL